MGSMVVTERPTQYNLVGADAKLVLRSDGSIQGGKIQVDWKCNTPITSTVFNTSTTTKSVTNTLEMAEALLTGTFTPEMGRDYGCAGRGLFDPFVHTIDHTWTTLMLLSLFGRSVSNVQVAIIS